MQVKVSAIYCYAAQLPDFNGFFVPGLNEASLMHILLSPTDAEKKHKKTYQLTNK